MASSLRLRGKEGGNDVLRTHLAAPRPATPYRLSHGPGRDAPERRNRIGHARPAAGGKALLAVVHCGDLDLEDFRRQGVELTVHPLKSDQMWV